MYFSLLVLYEFLDKGIHIQRCTGGNSGKDGGEDEKRGAGKGMAYQTNDDDEAAN